MLSAAILDILVQQNKCPGVTCPEAVYLKELLLNIYEDMSRGKFQMRSGNFHTKYASKNLMC